MDKFDLADVLSDATERLRYSERELERAQRDYDESLSVTYRNKRTLDHLKRKVYLENCVIAALLDTQLDAEDTSESEEKGDD